MQVTVYQIMSDLHLVNSLGGYIIMSCGTDVISMYIFIQFMENIPLSLDEVAIIDGANYSQIYRKIMFPLLKTGNRYTDPAPSSIISQASPLREESFHRMLAKPSGLTVSRLRFPARGCGRPHPVRTRRREKPSPATDGAAPSGRSSHH